MLDPAILRGLCRADAELRRDAEQDERTGTAAKAAATNTPE